MRSSRPTILAAALLMGIIPPGLAVFPKAAAAQSQPAQGQQLLKAEEVDQLVAPIALYPDTLLAEVLMASTYPLEVVEASRWTDDNKNLKGGALKAAADKQSWDDSVKSLTATPSVLSMMNGKLSWTQKLGDAVLAQQADVMDAVQRLRAKAQANNKLQNTKEQKVSTRTESNKQVIVIEPSEPNTIYVPYYDPGVVYGAWPYPAYPPYYFPAPPYIPGTLLATGLAFGAGFALGAWAGNNNFWGGGMNWSNNNININRTTNIGGGDRNWTHKPEHRQGVRYNNKDVANRFGRGDNARGNAQNRMDFRGRDGQQVLRPGGDRPGAGGGGIADRGNRPNAGNRPGGDNRPGGGNRPGAGGGGERRDVGNRGGGRPGGGGRGRENAFSNVGGGGRAAMAQSARGRASIGGGGGHPNLAGRGGGGGARAGGGGGRGGGGGGRGGGGRRSDINLKHGIVLLGHLDNGLGFYRFSYNGSDKAYVGVIAQEVQAIRPDAVTRGDDGYLRVRYDKLGVKFESYDHWIVSGARVPPTVWTH